MEKKGFRIFISCPFAYVVFKMGFSAKVTANPRQVGGLFRKGIRDRS